MPGHPRKCEITHVYGREEALEVIRRSQKDYTAKFGKIENKLTIAALEALELNKTMKARKKRIS